MRSLSHDASQERRVQLIRLRTVGRTYDEIAAQTGLSRTGVFDTCKRHELCGVAALKDKVGGRKLGEDRLLTAEQERHSTTDSEQDAGPEQAALRAVVTASGGRAYPRPVWAYGCGADDGTKQAPARAKLQLVEAASRHLRSVQKQPEQIRCHFQHDPVKYAA
jgi:hypothetical protein